MVPEEEGTSFVIRDSSMTLFAEAAKEVGATVVVLEDSAEEMVKHPGSQRVALQAGHPVDELGVYRSFQDKLSLNSLLRSVGISTDVSERGA